MEAKAMGMKKRLRAISIVKLGSNCFLPLLFRFFFFFFKTNLNSSYFIPVARVLFKRLSNARLFVFKIFIFYFITKIRNHFISRVNLSNTFHTTVFSFVSINFVELNFGKEFWIVIFPPSKSV